jgi:hypothetical protein
VRARPPGFIRGWRVEGTRALDLRRVNFFLPLEAPARADREAVDGGSVPAGTTSLLFRRRHVDQLLPAACRCCRTPASRRLRPDRQDDSIREPSKRTKTPTFPSGPRTKTPAFVAADLADQDTHLRRSADQRTTDRDTHLRRSADQRTKTPTFVAACCRKGQPTATSLCVVLCCAVTGTPTFQVSLR